jgi:UDP-N-acetylmuramate dehydrogenase
VYVCAEGSKKTLHKNQCDFKYRDSIFKSNSNLIVLGAIFSFDKLSGSSDLRKERIMLVKETQDYSAYNFGSVFRVRNNVIMHLIKILHPGYKKGVSFSGKTANWLLNEGEGTYSQAILLINRVERTHKIIGKQAIPEVIIWK